MTTIEYMEKQLSKHKANLERETARNVPKEMLDNIKSKIKYYQEACIALRCVGGEEL